MIFPSAMRLLLVLALGACQAKSPTGDADLRAATATTDAYFRALAAKDYAGMCATRTAAEREQIGKLSGSCEKGMEQQLGKLPADLFTGVTAANARRNGDRIEIDVMQPGAKEPAATVYLTREGSQWLLAAMPAAASSGSASPAPAADPVEPLAADDPDVLAAVAMIDAYVTAFVARDYEGMCATRTAEAKQKLAASAGSCVKMMEVFTRDQPVDTFKEMKPINPRRRGSILAFDLEKPGTARLFGPVYLQQEGGRWLMFERDPADKF